MLHILLPTPERFAKVLIAHLTRSGATITRFDAAEYTVYTPGGNLSLHNFYAEFLHLGWRGRWSYIPRLVSLELFNRPETPKDWPAAAPFILPTVKHKATFDQLLLRAELDSGKPAVIKQQVTRLGSSLYQMLCFDYPTMMMFSLEYDCQAEHKVTPAEAWQRALDNLWDKSKEDWEEPAPGVWLSPWRDNQDAARLSLPGLIRQLKVDGDPVALTVHRDMLIITGSNNHSAIPAIIKAATEQLQVPRAGRCPMLILTGDDRWIDYTPAPDATCFTAVTDWNHTALAVDYQEIHDLAVRALKHRGEDTTILPVKLMQDADADRQFALAPWDSDEPGLLPEAPIIAFLRKGKLIGFAPWSRVRKHAGALLEPISDLGRPYWRIKGFPDDATLSDMKVSADTPPWELLREALSDAS